jgi:hypothetical protein
MAAPAAAYRVSLTFRDAKGNTSRLRVLVGDATSAAVITDIGTLEGHVAAVTNAHTGTNLDSTPNTTYGTNATFASVEDGAILTFVGPNGDLHRYKIPAPKSVIFNTDGETVLPSQANIAAVINDFQTFVFGSDIDTAPLTYVGGTRIRRKQHRKLNIYIKDPTLTEPAE